MSMPRIATASRPSLRWSLGFVGLLLMLTGGAGPKLEASNPADAVARLSRSGIGQLRLWYEQTPPNDRIVWGGLAACAVLGLGVTFERMLRLRAKRIVPNDFQQRFHARLLEGRLDRGKATDYCELNPSPAARVTMAAVGRWGRSVSDLERGVNLARRREVDQLWKHLGTLRRIAALAPLLGLLGTLVSVSRALSTTTPAAGQLNWASVVASALGPLIGGVVLAILSLVAYDGLVARVEGFERSLDRLGAETVDAIAMSTLPEPRRSEIRTDSANLPRAPHPVRVDIPQPGARPRDRGRDEER